MVDAFQTLAERGEVLRRIELEHHARAQRDAGLIVGTGAGAIAGSLWLHSAGALAFSLTSVLLLAVVLNVRADRWVDRELGEYMRRFSVKDS